MSELISVITINYNNKQGLTDTLHSLFAQNYSNFESIVIDGGSEDGSLEVIDANKNRLAYSLSEPDNGPFHAMNKGIIRANGEFLLFLNSGDKLVHSDVLLEFIRHPKFQGQVIYGDYLFENGSKEYPDELTPYYFMRSSLPHQSTFIHRSVFEKIGLYDESFSICGDRDHFLRTYLSGEIEFSHVPIALSRFDLNGRSNDANWSIVKAEEDERLFRENYGLYYPDMLRITDQEERLTQFRRSTLVGYWKRFLKRIKKGYG